jgi:hypothetical protein
MTKEFNKQLNQQRYDRGWLSVAFLFALLDSHSPSELYLQTSSCSFSDCLEDALVP